MEISIKLIIVTLILIVVFLILVVMFFGWYGNASESLGGLGEFLNNLFAVKI